MALFRFWRNLVSHDQIPDVVLALTNLVMGANDEGQRDLFICECAAVITTNGTARMLCGLRGGAVVVLNIQWEQCRFALWLSRGQNFALKAIPMVNIWR